MIKLKEGQKVLDVDGNTYLIEKEDTLVEATTGLVIAKTLDTSMFSHNAVYNNDDGLFYALDTSYHTNDGWQLVPTSEKFSTSFRNFMGRYNIGKQINMIYIDDRNITVVISVKNMIDLNLQDLNKLYGLEKIRMDISSTDLVLYFNY